MLPNTPKRTETRPKQAGKMVRPPGFGPGSLVFFSAMGGRLEADPFLFCLDWVVRSLTRNLTAQAVGTVDPVATVALSFGFMDVLLRRLAF